MKKLILMAVVLLSSIGAFAQAEAGSFTLQPKVGINIASMTNIDDSKSVAGFVGGVEGQYQFSDLFGLSVGLLYSGQGVKEEYEDEDFSVSTKWKPAYLNIPILANVYVVKGLAVKAGIQPGFMVSKDDADDPKTFDFSIPVGLSYEYANVVLDARYNIGVTKVFDGDGDTPKNSVFQITLGYKFKL